MIIQRTVVHLTQKLFLIRTGNVKYQNIFLLNYLARLNETNKLNLSILHNYEVTFALITV